MSRRLDWYILCFDEEEHEDCRPEYDDGEEHINDPLNPEVRCNVIVVHSVVAARVQVGVREGGRHGARDVQRPVARVHFTACERDQCLICIVVARN